MHKYTDEAHHRLLQTNHPREPESHRGDPNWTRKSPTCNSGLGLRRHLFHACSFLHLRNCIYSLCVCFYCKNSSPFALSKSPPPTLLPHRVCFAMPMFSPDEAAFLEQGKDAGMHISLVNKVPMLITTCRGPVGLARQRQRAVAGSGRQLPGILQQVARCRSSSEFHNEFPYQLSLGQDACNKPLLPFRSDVPIGHRLLVTKPYNDLFHRILEKRRMDKGVTRGVVVTGQPGVGASQPDPCPVRQLNSALFCRQNHLPKIYVCPVDFSRPGCAPVR